METSYILVYTGLMQQQGKINLIIFYSPLGSRSIFHFGFSQVIILAPSLKKPLQEILGFFQNRLPVNQH